MADAAAMARANEPVPDMVKQFVVYFYRHIREKNGTSELPRRPRGRRDDPRADARAPIARRDDPAKTQRVRFGLDRRLGRPPPALV